jgi:hypothetical protein
MKQTKLSRFPELTEVVSALDEVQKRIYEAKWCSHTWLTTPTGRVVCSKCGLVKVKVPWVRPPERRIKI